MTEYPLPANAMPHTVTLDQDGAVWYTGNNTASLGKLDPRTGKIPEYKMPDPHHGPLCSHHGSNVDFLLPRRDYAF